MKNIISFQGVLGGSNAKENIVHLSPREHFICHLLLPKFTNSPGKEKMRRAIWMMSNLKLKKVLYKINSNTYDIIKKNFMSIRGSIHPLYGKKNRTNV